MSLAAETLRGRRFGIREHYPKTVEEERKSLYLVAKEARNKSSLLKGRSALDY